MRDHNLAIINILCLSIRIISNKIGELRYQLVHQLGRQKMKLALAAILLEEPYEQWQRYGFGNLYRLTLKFSLMAKIT